VSKLWVDFRDSTVVIPEGSAVSFGRATSDPGAPVGWGCGDRFIELAADDHIHRRWGRIRAEREVCFVTNLGSAWAITVILGNAEPIRLKPWTMAARSAGADPDELAVTAEHFTIELRAGASSWELHCRQSSVTDAAELATPTAGQPTRGLRDMVTDSITRNEFRVLWAMSGEFRSAAVTPNTERPPRPLSYTRITRLLDLDSTRQATAAVERLVRRFREGMLLTPDLDPGHQRAALCATAVDLGILDALTAKYGHPVSDDETVGASERQDGTGG